jgi:hypothetical protein
MVSHSYLTSAVSIYLHYLANKFIVQEVTAHSGHLNQARRILSSDVSTSLERSKVSASVESEVGVSVESEVGERVESEVGVRVESEIDTSVESEVGASLEYGKSFTSNISSLNLFTLFSQ